MQVVQRVWSTHYLRVTRRQHGLLGLVRASTIFFEFFRLLLTSLQFRFTLRVSVMFHCVELHPQKNFKPNKRAVSTKSTRIAIILNPSAGPLRRFDLL